jgi:O-antigen/teichoic acid export membrane protein
VLHSLRRRVEASPEKLRILGDAGWMFAAQAASALGLLLGMRLLTEQVPPSVFGSVSLLIGLVTIGTDIFCVPLLDASRRFYPDSARCGQTEALRKSVRHSLVRTSGLFAAALLAFGAIAHRAIGVSLWAFVALATLLIAQVFRAFETDFLMAARRVRPYALATTAENWLRPALAIGVVLVFGACAEAVFLGYCAGSLAVCAALAAFRARSAQNLEDADRGTSPAFDRDLRSFAMPLMPLAVAAWISSAGDRYIVGGLVGPEAVGLYAAAYGIVSRPFLMLNGVLGVVFQPVYFDAVSSRNDGLARKSLRVWLTAAIAALSLGAVVTIVFRQEIAALLLAEKYRSCAELMPWIALGHVLMATSRVVEQPCYAYLRTSWITAVRWAGALCSIVVAIPLVAFYGLAGAAWAVPIYFGIELVTALWLTSFIRKPR